MARESACKDRAVPIRSLVYVGALDDDRVRRAIAAGSDAVWFDLEDPQVPFGPSHRAEARSMIADHLDATTSSERPLNFVRITHPSSEDAFMADLEAVLGVGLAGVLLPQVSGPEDIENVDAVLSTLEIEKGLVEGSTQVIPLLETARSIRLAFEIGVASARVTYMGGMISRFGNMQQALGHRWTAAGEESLFIRSKVLIDARAAGVRYPISGVWAGDAADTDGLRRWAEGLRNLGYAGMLMGGESVELVNDVFSPTPQDIAFWEAIVEAGETASDEGPALLVTGPTGSRVGLHYSYIDAARQNLIWARGLGLASS